jgi:hypothetical protein
MSQQQLFNDKEFGGTCSKCGHSAKEHDTPHGYCHCKVGQLECKCSSFAQHDMSKLRPDLFHDRREEA